MAEEGKCKNYKEDRDYMRRQTAGASWLIGFAALVRGSMTSGKISAITKVSKTMMVHELTASLLFVIRGPLALSIARCAVI